MKKLISVMGLSLISGMAFAECTTSRCTGYVERIFATAAGKVYIGTDGDENSLNCTPVEGVYTTLDMSDAGADAIYSALLAAQVAGKKATVRIDDGSPDCSIRYIMSDKQ